MCPAVLHARQAAPTAAAAPSDGSQAADLHEHESHGVPPHDARDLSARYQQIDKMTTSDTGVYVRRGPLPPSANAVAEKTDVKLICPKRMASLRSSPATFRGCQTASRPGARSRPSAMAWSSCLMSRLASPRTPRGRTSSCSATRTSATDAALPHNSDDDGSNAASPRRWLAHKMTDGPSMTAAAPSRSKPTKEEAKEP